MNTETLARATFVLDKTTSAQLSFVARRMGVSRSALVREVLAVPVERMASMVASIPPDPSPQDVRDLAQLGLDFAEEISSTELQPLRELARRD